MNKHKEDTSKNDRKEWIGILSEASRKDLELARETLQERILYNYVVQPETGMLMVQARTDGSKSNFNFGEISVSRCILQIRNNFIGYACVMGSDLKHAELAALFDALLQMPEFNERLSLTLIPMLKEKQQVKRNILRKKAASTKVDFFTLKRGE